MHLYNFEMRELVKDLNNFDEEPNIKLTRDNSSRRIPIKSLLLKYKEFLLYKLFGIDEKEFEAELEYINMYIPREAYDPKGNLVGVEENFSELIQMKDYKFINTIFEYSPYLSDYIDRSDDYLDKLDYHINCTLASNFPPQLYVSGKFKYHQDISFGFIANESTTKVKMKLYGLTYYDDLQYWKELMLTSFIFYNSGDEKTALFTAFTAFELYINQGIAKINYDNLYGKLDDEIIISLIDCKNEILRKNKNHLINGRLRVLMDFTGVNKIRKDPENENRKELERAYGHITAVNKIRNKIAHGEQIEVDDIFLDFIYSMLTIMSFLGTKLSLDSFFRNYTD